MKVSLADILQLAGTDPGRLQRVGELARELNVLEQKRAAILAELAEFGIGEDAATAAEPSERKLPPNVPRCTLCGQPGDMTVDDKWYCMPHGDEICAGRLEN